MTPHPDSLPLGRELYFANAEAWSLQILFGKIFWLLERLLIPATCCKFLASSQHNFLNPDFRRSALGGIATDGDRISKFDRTLCPSNSAQTIGACELPLPLLSFSGLILAVQKNEHMRIDELKIGHGAFYGDRFRRIVVRRSVM